MTSFVEWQQIRLLRVISRQWTLTKSTSAPKCGSADATQYGIEPQPIRHWANQWGWLCALHIYMLLGSDKQIPTRLNTVSQTDIHTDRAVSLCGPCHDTRCVETVGDRRSFSVDTRPSPSRTSSDWETCDFASTRRLTAVLPAPASYHHHWYITQTRDRH